MVCWYHKCIDWSIPIHCLFDNDYNDMIDIALFNVRHVASNIDGDSTEEHVYCISWCLLYWVPNFWYYKHYVQIINFLVHDYHQLLMDLMQSLASFSESRSLWYGTIFCLFCYFNYFVQTTLNLHSCKIFGADGWFDNLFNEATMTYASAQA